MRQRKALLSLASLLTFSASLQADVILSEFCDPSSSYQTGRFVEIYNTGTDPVSIEGWKVVVVENGKDARTCNLTGTINAGQALTCAAEPNSFGANFITTGVSNWSSFNGKGGDGAKLVNDSEAIIDIFVQADTEIKFENARLERNSDIGTANATGAASEWSQKTAATVSDATPNTHTYGASTVPTVAITSGSTHIETRH